MVEKTNYPHKIHGPLSRIQLFLGSVCPAGDYIAELLHLHGALWQASPMEWKQKGSVPFLGCVASKQVSSMLLPLCRLEGDSEALRNGQP